MKPDYLARQAAKAKVQPSFTNEYLRLHLNVWTQQVTRWLSLERWAECDPIPPAPMCRESPRLGSSSARRALVLRRSGSLVEARPRRVRPRRSRARADVVDLICRFWLPEATIKAYAKKGQKHYLAWAREGWLSKTPGDVIDYEFIRKEVVALSKRFMLQELAFDPGERRTSRPAAGRTAS
jgi:phage terminase large subunit-like protein